MIYERENWAIHVEKDNVQRKRLMSHSCMRSEEHTSELQSPCNLVCRLLLEKKKKNTRSVQIRAERAWHHSSAVIDIMSAFCARVKSQNLSAATPWSPTRSGGVHAAQSYST